MKEAEKEPMEYYMIPVGASELQAAVSHLFDLSSALSSVDIEGLYKVFIAYFQIVSNSQGSSLRASFFPLCYSL